MDDNTNDFSNIMNQLGEIKEKEKKEWGEDIIKRTISSLLSIEKKAFYGSLRGKIKKMDEIMLSEMKNSRSK